MQYKLHCGFFFVFVISFALKSYCTEYAHTDLDLFKTDVYFSKCEITFFDLNFIGMQTAQNYLSSTTRPLLISNKNKTKAKFYSSRYQLVRCKIIIAVEDNNSEPLKELLNLHAFKESNYFIIFNLTSKFINLGELSKFNSFIHVLIHSSSTKVSYQSYDYVQECNCLKLAHMPFGNVIFRSQKDRWNFNKKIVFIGHINKVERIGLMCPRWFSRYGCPPHYKIIEMHGNYFNFTLHYKDQLKVSKFFWDIPLYEKDVYTYISDNMNNNWNRNYSNDSLQYFFTVPQTYTLAYCEDELKFPNLSFQYWVSPFTLNVWVLIIAVVFITSMITSIGNSKSLHFTIFVHISVLLRQGVPDRISLIQVGLICVFSNIYSLRVCYYKRCNCSGSS